MTKVETEVFIAAPCAKVWELVMDWSSYPSWNPYYARIEGDAKPGARLRVQIQTPGLPPATLKPTLWYLTPERYCSWHGNLLTSLVLDTEHYFELQPSGANGCRFRHGERFSGLAAKLFGGLIDRLVRPRFAAMNEALRARAEGQALTPTETTTPKLGAARAANPALGN